MPDPVDQSRQFNSDHRIPEGDKISAGYKDGGRRLNFDDTGKPINAPGREIITVKSVAEDPSLKRAIETVKAKTARMSSTEEKVHFINKYVAELLSENDPDINERILNKISGGSMVGHEVSLGQLIDAKTGVCRHRALLFKVLADEVGVPTAIVRGNYIDPHGPSGGHAWNEAILDDGTRVLVDPMHDFVGDMDHPKVRKYADVHSNPLYHEGSQYRRSTNKYNLDPARPNANIAQVDMGRTKWTKGKIVGQDWQSAKTTDGQNITRMAVNDLSEKEIGAIEETLRAQGYTPVRHTSSTMGETIRLSGNDAHSMTNQKQRAVKGFKEILEYTDWESALTKEGQPITRISTKYLDPHEIQGLEDSLRAAGLNPERRVSSTMGETIRLSGEDALKAEGLMKEIKIKKANEILKSDTTKGFLDPKTGDRYFYETDNVLYESKIANTDNKIVIITSDGTTKLTTFDSAQEAEKFFSSKIDEIGRSTGKMVQVVDGGAEVLDDAIRSGKSILGRIGKGLKKGGKFFGKLTKVLGPIGIVAATAEVNSLYGRATSAIDLGLLSEDSMIEYDAILATHIAQATFDPTFVGGEAIILTAFEEWADKHDVPKYMRKELEPGTLMKTIFGSDAPPRENLPSLEEMQALINEDVMLIDVNSNTNINIPFDMQQEFNEKAKAIEHAEALEIKQARSPIEVIQESLGITVDGQWGPQTNEAFAKLMAEAQLSKEYEGQFPPGEGQPDFFYGRKTEMAMFALGYDEELIVAISKLDQDGRLHELYSGPENPGTTMDSVKTTSVQLYSDKAIEHENSSTEAPIIGLNNVAINNVMRA